MIRPSLSFLSRRLSFLPFLLALMFGLLGAAPLINNALYTRNKIFISWLLINFQSDNQWLFPIFVWGIAGGFLLFGIVRRRRKDGPRYGEFNQSETTGMTRTYSPKFRSLFRKVGIGAYLVLTCMLCIFSFGSQLGDPFFTVYENRLSYQGHIYLLSVTPDRQLYGPMFDFEVSQCDVSGWFCHVIYDVSHTVRISVDGSVIPFSSMADLINAHLQADTPQQRLFIVYQGEDSGKLLCPIPS